MKGWLVGWLVRDAEDLVPNFTSLQPVNTSTRQQHHHRLQLWSQVEEQKNQEFRVWLHQVASRLDATTYAVQKRLNQDQQPAKGRASRIFTGEHYGRYTREIYEALEDAQPLEMLRKDLDSLALAIKRMCAMPSTFLRLAIDPPLEVESSKFKSQRRSSSLMSWSLQRHKCKRPNSNHPKMLRERPNARTRLGPLRGSSP